ncbi:MAG: universal stress protein [Anaerolineales bacterium]|nr:universal stress protein [Anaerolineales bacterium]
MTATQKPKEQDTDTRRTKKILLAYDGSEHAQAAVDLLASLPLAGRRIDALAVMPTQHIGGHENLKVSLETARQRLSASGAQVNAELRAGNPAATINASAEELQVDLIVVGAKGLRSTLGILLGGVAQQVVEYSTRPVLVVRAPYRQLKRVLVVTDGSPHSQQALQYLAPLCPEKQPGGEAARRRCFWLPEAAQVHLMHVLPPPIISDMNLRAWAVGPEALYPAPIPPVDTKAIEEEEQHQGEHILNEALAVLAAAHVPAETYLPRGDAATEIIEHVKHNQVDLIVCGSRGLNPVTGWLLGSVSRKLVHYAPCSVMIVKGQAAEN